ALAPGAIVCLHDRAGSGTKADLVARRREEIAALPGWLDDARAAGYRFVTVSGLLVPPQGRPRGA
ncbi:MAG: hypothetical protein JWM05_863, partial [Acidimicrobiales bacterium]|nr:hypothetical protein [Acidimicrobiales bacterium]